MLSVTCCGDIETAVYALQTCCMPVWVNEQFMCQRFVCFWKVGRRSIPLEYAVCSSGVPWSEHVVYFVLSKLLEASICHGMHFPFTAYSYCLACVSCCVIQVLLHANSVLWWKGWTASPRAAPRVVNVCSGVAEIPLLGCWWLYC